MAASKSPSSSPFASRSPLRPPARPPIVVAAAMNSVVVPISAGPPPSDPVFSLGNSQASQRRVCPSFKEVASSRGESSVLPAAIPEAPAISIQMPDEALEFASELSKTSLVCRFNGFWPSLADLRSWISSAWSPLVEGEIVACPCAKGFFVAIFDSNADRFKVSSSGPWFWGRAGLSMKPWTPDFDPSTASISTAPVWVRLPSLPLHFWEGKSLESIGNGLGKFLCNCPDESIDRTTFARICVEMDFKNGFPAEINLLGKGYSWTQKIDYENLCFRCRVCFETGHIARNCEKSSGKRRLPRSQRPTWWKEAPPEKQVEGKTPAPEEEADSAPKELAQRTDPVEIPLPTSPKPTQGVSNWADIADAEETQGQTGNHEQGQSSEWQTVSKKKKKPIQHRTDIMTRSRSGSAYL